MAKYSVGTAFTLQNAAVANGNGNPMSIDGYATVLVSIRSSIAMSGGTTVNFEVSSDNSNWTAIAGTKVGSSLTAAATTTADGDFRFSVAGYRKFRARVSAYSAGTVTITGNGTMAPVGTDLTSSTAGGAATVADGADVAEGAVADAIVAAGAVGTISAKLRRTTQGLEDLKSLIVLAAGTNAIGKLAANSGVDIGDVTVDNAAGTNPVPVQGNVAHDGAAAGNPVLLGGQYKASPAKVSTDGDATTLAVTQEGKLLIPPWTAAADTKNDNANYGAAQTNTSLTNATAPGATKRLVIVEIMYSRDTAGNMKLVGDPLGTPATVFGPHYFPANGGMISTQCYVPVATNKALGITSVGGGNETITTRCIVENV